MVNNQYKLLVIDIDGTLLGKNNIISAEDKNALARASDSGVRVALSTGRVTEACKDIIHQLSLNGYHIFFDGALVRDPKNDEDVYARPVSEDLVRQIIEYSHLNGINLDLYSSTNYFVESETWVSDIRREFFKIEPTVGGFTNLWKEERIIKGNLTVRSAEEKAKADKFHHHFKSNLGFSWAKTPAYPEVDFINVLTSGVSKGEALEALTSFLGVTLNETVAIGDGANDISLLSKAGLAIAMDNGPDELKAVADHVTLSIEHNGVAAAVDEFLL
ncbi:Cof-type HAD-IIB family hydrolase [Chloroflexota bacterium]